MKKNISQVSLAILAVIVLSSCVAPDRQHKILVSVPDQKMLVLKDDMPIASYPVSTSKFGLGDLPGSNATPLGRMAIAKKIGTDAVPGTVFKSRKPTGEVIPVNAPGRDPIVTRILWLKGLEDSNRQAYRRHIYIHGTPEERNVGQPVSYGCVRMRSSDIIDLYNHVGKGARVWILNAPMENIVPVAQSEK